jgi:DNA repair protein RadC
MNRTLGTGPARIACSNSLTREEGEPPYTATSQPALPSAERPFFGSAADVWAACRDLQTEDREHAVVLFLDVRHRLLGSRWTAAIGTVTGVEMGTREVYREALLRGAVSLILAHNHPSGDPTPSRQDIEITRRFREAGDLIGVRLLDHIVIGADGFVSMMAT